MAATNGQLEVVKILVEYGAATVSNGFTASPLVIAAQALVQQKYNTEEEKDGLIKVIQYFISKRVTDYDWGTKDTSISKEEFDAVIAEQSATMEAEASIVEESPNAASNLDLIATQDSAQFAPSSGRR